MEANLRSDKMREQPVGRLLLAMSVPAIFSMLVQALYNVVDSIFVSMKYGSDGMTALSIASPFQFVFMAFAVGIGVGTNVQIAKKLGENKKEEATQVAKTGLFLSLCAAVLFIIVGLTVVKPYVNAFSETEEIAKLGNTYLSICVTLSFGLFIEVVCSKILQATGNMKIPMVSQLIGAVTNIILDPLLIFGIGFFPELGVKGAAIATITGQIFSMTFVLLVFIFKKQDVSISPKGFKIKKEHILAICIIGLPTMLMNALNGVTTSIQNAILKPISSSGIAILGTYFKLQSFIYMPVFGLTQGLMPILSYNYGYGDIKRFKETRKLAIISALLIMLLGLILFQSMPGLLMKMFSAKGEHLTKGIYALRIISISFFPAAFNIINTTTMQSLGKGLPSLIVSVLRQVGILIPVGALLGTFTGLNGFWFTYPIAEITVFCFFLPFTLKAVKKKFEGVNNDRKKEVSQNLSEDLKRIVSDREEDVIISAVNIGTEENEDSELNLIAVQNKTKN